MPITEKAVIDALRYVEDPDLKKDLVTLGMIRHLKITENRVAFTVMLTTPACPMKELIHKACVNAILQFVDSNAEVTVTMDAEVINTKAKADGALKHVRHIIAVASGKGGVGKSTIAANLALGLSLSGARVGIVDADIYGPSQHIMFGVENERPGPAELNGAKKMAPVESYGIKLNSIGFLAAPDQVVALRGPMATKALTQLFFDTDWGELDYLIVDLPPGTGDIHITLCSQIPLSGAVIVCTPQPVAIADARKGISLFKLSQLNVPVLGLIENMSWFTPQELPQNKYYIFGKDGVRHLSEELNIPLLAQLPLIQSIREAADAGRPAILHDKSIYQEQYIALAQNVAQRISLLHSL